MSTVKIPNNHKNNFGPNKAKNVARQLAVSQDQYNELIECTFSGQDYYKLQSDSEGKDDLN